MKIYTKNGDKGNTNFFMVVLYPRTILNQKQYGTVDELVASLGIIRAEERFTTLKLKK